jgi:hypothetical protein
MKLYEVPRETYIQVLEDVHVPPGCDPIKSGDVIFFDHIDGMYSFCMDVKKQHVLHVAAFTEVKVLEEGPCDQCEGSCKVVFKKTDEELDVKWCPTCKGLGFILRQKT